jgi:hypothetical protein
MELFGYVCSPLCRAKAESHGISVPVYEGQRSVADARFWRRMVWVGGGAGAVIVGLLGFWFWYAWFGCLPHPIFSVRFSQTAYSGQSVLWGKDKDQLVLLRGGTLSRHDLHLKKQLWSVELLDPTQFSAMADTQLKAMQQANQRLRDNGAEDIPPLPDPARLVSQMERTAGEALSLHVYGQNVWVESPGKLTCYDWNTGKSMRDMTVQSSTREVISRGDELLVVDTDGPKPVVTHINLSTCESRTEDLNGPDMKLMALQKAGTAASPGSGNRGSAGLPLGTPGRDLGKPMDPGKVAEQAGHLSLPARIALPATLANSMNQERAMAALKNETKAPPNAAPSNGAAPDTFTLIPTHNGFLEVSVHLLESRIVERSAMKAAPGKSVVEGNLTAGNSLEAANETLNEMQRSRGGNVVQEDLSRYQVTLRRPGNASTWSGEVIGPPRMFPMQTVNVLAAGTNILVFDIINRKLWQTALSFKLPDSEAALDEENAPEGRGPCVEHKGSLYVFDEGVLSVFNLTNGNSRWRLPTVGVTGLFFDDQDMLYVNTTTASHENLKYSRQIDISQKIKAVVLKVDSRNGQVLWSAEPGGSVSYVSGNLVLVAQSYAPPEEDSEGTGFETPPHLRIRRINPRNGTEVWEYFQQRAPIDVGFDKGLIRLLFKKEIQVIKYATY